MTRDEAIAKSETNWWKSSTDEQIVAFQLYEPKLCMPFDEFHRAVEAVLGRPVWTHEFAAHGRLAQEHQGARDKGTVKESMELLETMAGDKPIVVVEVGG